MWIIYFTVSLSTLLFYFLTSKIFKSKIVADFLASLVVILSLNYESFKNIFRLIPNLDESTLNLLTKIFALLVLGLSVVIAKKVTFNKSLLKNIKFCLVILILVNMSTLVLTIYQNIDKIPLDSPKIQALHKKALPSPEQFQNKKNIKLRNVYLFVLDGYPRYDLLETTTGYKNENFYQELKGLNGHIVKNSFSNYNGTLNSIASFLNLNYNFKNDLSSELSDTSFLRALISNNYFFYFLKGIGYEINFINNGYFIPSSIADRNFDIFQKQGLQEIRDKEYRKGLIGIDHRANFESIFSRFAHRLLYTNLERLIKYKDNIFKHQDDSERELEHYDSVHRLNETLNFNQRIKSSEKPALYYVHIMSPHGPTKVTEDGSELQSTWKPTPNQFLGELKYLNKRMVETIKNIKEKDNDGHIIIVSDHGSKLGSVWSENTTEPYFENLIYVQTGNPEFSELLGEKVSLVNLLRHYLNFYFDLKLEILKDRYFTTPRGLKEMFYFTEFER